MAGVIITGAFGALGRAVAAELTARGHAVAAVDVAPAADGINAEIVLGGVDLTDEAAVGAAYAKAAEALGGIAALVNIAGGFVWEPVEGGKVDSWNRMYRMNVETAFISSRAALPYLLESKGAIVNIGAAGAAQPAAGMGAYAASKSGVRALTESLAEELRGKGVRVNAVLPTTFDTPTNRRDMPDVDPASWVKPLAAARVIAFLISSESAAITGAAIPLSLAG